MKLTYTAVFADLVNDFYQKNEISSGCLKKLKTNLHGKRKQGKRKISMIVQPIKSKQVW